MPGLKTHLGMANTQQKPSAAQGGGQARELQGSIAADLGATAQGMRRAQDMFLCCWTGLHARLQHCSSGCPAAQEPSSSACGVPPHGSPFAALSLLACAWAEATAARSSARTATVRIAASRLCVGVDGACDSRGRGGQASSAGRYAVIGK